tara:strand:- start:7721 stop:7888 length:168 start_codon:yes stop_codon:yes gene_type:complete
MTKHGRTERREEALERQQLRDARTPQQQLALIKTRRGESVKETVKLIALLDQKTA